MDIMQQALVRERMREREDRARRALLVKELAAPSRWRRVQLQARAACRRHLLRANRAGVPAAAEGLRVGDAASRTRTVTARDIELFTELTGDRNPLHYDPQLARRSRFGGIVVQGGVTSGLLNALVAEDLPGPGSVFLHVDWAFRAPVQPGDVITAEAAVTSIRADKPVTTLSTTITNQDGVVVLDGTAVVWRDPAVANG